MKTKYERYNLCVKSFEAIQDWLFQNRDKYKLRIESWWNNKRIYWFDLDFEHSLIRAVSIGVNNPYIYVYVTAPNLEFRLTAHDFCNAFHKLQISRTAKITPLNADEGVVLKLSMHKLVSIYAPKLTTLNKYIKYEN